MVQIRLDDATINDPDTFKKYQLAQDRLGSSISVFLQRVEPLPILSQSQVSIIAMSLGVNIVVPRH